jgi:uncharacterized protein (DUF2141 family)
VIYEGVKRGSVIVNLYKLSVSSEGRAVRLTKGDIYGDVDPLQTLKLDKAGSYVFDGLVPGQYSVVAFVDTDGNRQLGFDPPEPFGWFASKPGGSWEPINLTQSDATGCDS